MKRSCLVILLSMLYLLVLAQTNSGTLHLYRVEDIIYRNAIGNFDIGERGDSCIWDLHDIKIYKKCLATEFR